MENLEQSVSDVSSEQSSPSPESQSAPKAAPAPAEAVSKEPPFHEHPRFKEIINKNNEYSQRLQDYEKRFQELSGKLEQSTPKAPTPESKLIERLKGVDPEFGQFMEQQHATRAQLEAKLQAMEQWKASQEQNTYRGQITSSLEKLHTEHKVPEAVRELYEAQLERIAKANPHLSLQDLPNVYKGIHEKFNGYMESVKRDTLSSYTTSKTKDASIPSAPKGTTPKPGTSKIEYSKDPAEARKQIVERTMKSLRNQ